MATKIDILHANLAYSLKCVVDPANDYSEALDEIQRPKFEQYITSLIDLINRNELLKAENKSPVTFYDGFDGLDMEILKSDTVIDKFEREFPAYPVKRGSVIKLICLIIEKIKIIHGNDDPISGSFARKLLIVYPNKLIIPKINFFFDIENNNVSQTITLLNSSVVQEGQLRENLFQELPINLDVLFHFLWAIERTFLFKTGQYYILKKTPAKPKSFNNVKSFIKLKLVSVGKQVHHPYHTSILPSLPPNLTMKMAENYQQFDDIINILSEYNARKDDILEKYLKLYHVVENFMFKYPVCKLYNSNASSVFTIRDFRNIYQKVETSEIQALTDFIKDVFDLDYTIAPVKKIKTHVFSEWGNFKNVNVLQMPNVFAILTKIGVSETISDPAKANAGAFFSYYAQMVYKTRNTIVHNKDTEHHFNISKLPPEVPLYIEKFLLPTLEQIIYKLIADKNPIVTYKKQVMKMWLD